MSESADEPERLVEILRELVALSSPVPTGLSGRESVNQPDPETLRQEAQNTPGEEK